jgi:hypothetical protein
VWIDVSRLVSGYSHLADVHVVMTEPASWASASVGMRQGSDNVLDTTHGLGPIRLRLH